jgi:hypothetical protein
VAIGDFAMGWALGDLVIGDCVDDWDIGRGRNRPIAAIAQSLTRQNQSPIIKSSIATPIAQSPITQSPIV